MKACPSAAGLAPWRSVWVLQMVVGRVVQGPPPASWVWQAGCCASICWGMGALRLVHQRGPWRSPDPKNASRVGSGSSAHSQTSLGRSSPCGQLWLRPWLLLGVYPRLGPWDVYTPGTCRVPGPECLFSTLVLAWILGLGAQQGT